MPSRILVQSLVLVSVVCLVFLALQHKPLGYVLHPLGAAISAPLHFVLVFEHLMWRAPGIGWLTKRRNLQGTWRRGLRSDWLNSETGEPRRL